MRKLFYLILLVSCICSCRKEQAVPVEMDVVFKIKDGNHTSPLYVTIENRTRHADSFRWTFEGGEPAYSSLKQPGLVLFSAPGEHFVRLEAWNEGDRTTGTYSLRVDSAVSAFFSMEAEINNYAPAVFRVVNRSSGGLSYRWRFAGGDPDHYEGQNPPPVTYGMQGTFPVDLTIENGSACFTCSREIEVRASLEADFELIPSFEDEDDWEAPLRAEAKAYLGGVETIRWTCPGAAFTDDTAAQTEVYFPNAGKYTVSLEVSNGKKSLRTDRDITVRTNTNLRTHRDICMGINTAGKQFPFFYSTKLRRSFRAEETDAENGPWIDLAYFGLNDRFLYNRFVSPDRLDETPLPAIPSARPTRYMDTQGKNGVDPDVFASMTTDEALRHCPLFELQGCAEYFPAELQGVLLFETADGRRGAMCLKDRVIAGSAASYIIVDIKIQKND